MMEIEDFDWQVFISYSWKDNTGTEKKWVDEFEQLLDAELKRLGQNMRIKLWRDKNQGENEYFSKSIPDGLAQSDLFIGLLSENFLGSGWCPDEIEYFKSYWKDKSPGLLVDGKKSRFFKVLLSDLLIEQLPEPFSQSNPFRFYDENHKNKIRLYSSETAYQQRMEELAGEIVNTINTIIKIMPEQEPERKEEFSLFVADVHDSLTPIKEELESRLLADKIVLPEPIPPPMKFFEHSSKINTVVPKTKLSVHLLYPTPGRKIVDCREKTYPWHQAELVARLNHPQVILMYRKQTQTAVEAGEYKEWLDKKVPEYTGSSRVFFDKFEKGSDVIQAVEQRIREIRNQERGGAPFILIHCRQSDREAANRAAEILTQYGLEKEILLRSKNDPNYEQTLNDRLYITSDFVFILSSKDQFKELFAQCCKYDIQRRPDKFFWVFFLPAMKQEMGTLFMECSAMAPPWINVRPIDNTDSGEVKPGSFDALKERHKTKAGESS